MMLTAKQHELLRFIQRKLEDTGISPSFEEMKEALDLKSKSGVHRLISALEERGFIRRLPNRARALEVLREPENVAAERRAAPLPDNVIRMPTATASGRAVIRSVVADPRANTVPITDAPVMSPRLRVRLSMPEMTPRWSGRISVITAVLLAVWNSA